MVKRRNGHAPGHVRDTFLEAVEAYRDWEPGAPEPVVDFEVNYEPRPIPISRACGLVWNCTDIIPGDAYRTLRDDVGLTVGRQTYAACARAMRFAIATAG